MNLWLVMWLALHADSVLACLSAAWTELQLAQDNSI
jgi:hypothetical protein